MLMLVHIRDAANKLARRIVLRGEQEAGDLSL